MKHYDDDTLHGLHFHRSGELVNRKPLALKMKKPRNCKRRLAISTKMGNSFLKKLEKLGL